MQTLRRAWRFAKTMAGALIAGIHVNDAGLCAQSMMRDFPAAHHFIEQPLDHGSPDLAALSALARFIYFFMDMSTALYGAYKTAKRITAAERLIGK